MNKTASICIIGSELTKGIIGDKHSQLISQELYKLNISVNQIIIVNDDGSIEKVLESWLDDNDLIIVTGGLGPTSDDLTRSAIAKVANVNLVKNKEAYDDLYKRVQDRIHGANYSQVYIPDGFSVLRNPNGTAAGFYGNIKKSNRNPLIVSMPGPPRELKPMFFDQVLPYLKNYVGYSEKQSVELSTFLICESKLEEACTSLAKKDISWGTRFQDDRISLFVTGNDSANFIESLRKLIGKELVVDGNETALNMLINTLKEKNLTISCAESCTGGLCAKLLTDNGGSSSFFEGGVVSYSNKIKNKVLNVKSETLEKYGAVSKETVIEMAENTLSLLDTDVAFSISGIAGPTGGTPEKPVGTVWFGFSSKNAKSQAVKLNFSVKTRFSIRNRAAVAAFLLTCLYLNEYSLLDIINGWEYI
ncbi:MAG: nicotinamide-nucleotide amidohydrolase family protein [Pleomorphochaeta sp.]